MKRAFGFCLLLSAAVGVGSAQDFIQNGKPPSHARIEALLESDVPRQIAWGAHYAVAANDQALVPALVSLADGWQPIAGTAEGDDTNGPNADQLERRDAMAAVLDALIQMKASVPVSVLRNLAPDFPGYVAVLLSRLPLGESQALSLEFFHSEPKTPNEHSLQYVSAALLAEAPPPGFAADLFSSIHVEDTITITRPGSPMEGYGICGDSFCGPPVARAHWPQFGVYLISENKVEGGFEIVSQAHPVYVYRKEGTYYTGDRCENGGLFAVLGPEERRRLIAQMLDVPADDLEWEATARQTIEFKSEPQFYGGVLGLIAAQQEQFRETAMALAAKDLITVAEKEESMPQIELRFLDQRGPGFAPIAQPPLLPLHVTWSRGPE